MKVNELRIGNLIVESLSFGSDKVIKVDSNIFNRRIDEFIPIPLTEEWLFKFGFLKDLENDIFLNINAYAFLCWQNNRVELLDNDNNFMISHCDYVHQLQNLYFALTGEELTFKSE